MNASTKLAAIKLAKGWQQYRWVSQWYFDRGDDRGGYKHRRMAAACLNGAFRLWDRDNKELKAR